MDYNQAIEYIHGTLKFGMKLGLENIKTLLEAMGNPHKSLKYVHVAGTNGKGSTCTFIGSILQNAGYKVGMYTSPYIENFTERIKINTNEIPKQDLAKITQFVRQNVKDMLLRGFNHPTEFEITTAIAFQYFHENNCDIVVLEVGLGGLYDSTNIIDSALVSVVTAIGHDHMDRLGDSLSQIAQEKAGIIKRETSVILSPQVREVEEVFEMVCTKKEVKLHKVDSSRIKINKVSLGGQKFDYDGFNGLSISLLGEHQVVNAATAVEAVLALRHGGYHISEGAIKKGLEVAKWPGRLEILSRKPFFIIDGAHNLEGSQALSRFINRNFPKSKKVFIMGILKDKDYMAVIREMAPLAQCIIAVTPKNERALPAAQLLENIKLYCNCVLFSDTIEAAVKKSFEIADDDSLICAFGSLYYIGEVRGMFSPV
ncbi:MAG: bifunctional folylpolyglutamate synthase/dihydrofolate synthase [Clostridium sp.]|nr:bifunctional folylpolyglutamate synthase/dihydrofolate synthase [Clostridium sp.]